MDDYNYIGGYFSGNLSTEEMKRFDQKIQEDPAFAGEVAFYCSAIQEIKTQAAHEKKNRFREIYELQGLDKKSRPPLVYMNKWWKIAAAATVIIFFAASWFWISQASVESLADGYIKDNFAKLPVKMGKSNPLQTAADLYNDNKWTASLQQFEAVIQSDTANFTAIKDAGIVALRLKEYDKALKYFTQIENHPDLYYNTGKLLHALTLIERGRPADKQEAKQLLQQIVQQDLEGKEVAAKWLKNW